MLVHQSLAMSWFLMRALIFSTSPNNRYTLVGRAPPSLKAVPNCGGFIYKWLVKLNTSAVSMPSGLPSIKNGSSNCPLRLILMCAETLFPIASTYQLGISTGHANHNHFIWYRQRLASSANCSTVIAGLCHPRSKSISLERGSCS